jgi:hypothetical protein
MHIPQEFGQFSRPTLVVASDSAQARLFLAKQNIVEEIELIESGYPPKTDLSRTSGQTPDGMHFAEMSENLKTESRIRLYRALSDNLLHRLQKKEFVDLVVAAAEEHADEVKESLHIELVKRLRAVVPKILTKDDPLDIVIHAKEAIDNPF